MTAREVDRCPGCGADALAFAYGAGALCWFECAGCHEIVEAAWVPTLGVYLPVVDDEEEGTPA